ncbi:hypothetical protein [Methylobacterium gnaphalii]|uniref:hypothetical protein n=1 Tax=Methylobacterium gnaphalii TaxID=1010610 RepID=UPI0011BFE6D5|nr:hypothetical protein [Methylobacterium gnaphalii]GJD67891.1 hypothetical protein MMMDOFMJ_0809 [Methylobacterium gnaphalii]
MTPALTGNSFAESSGTKTCACPLSGAISSGVLEMLKGGLLWLIGIPLPVILLIYFFTPWLH